tara:strand:- start:2602 stop:3207 length:606 start_codon:yes stop_codon:yes gene_type:complete
MTAICTNSEVFEFVGAKADVITNQGTAVTNLITRVTGEVESTIGRKITTTAFTDIFFNHGLNCEISGNYLWFKGIYRDIYSITAIEENGVALTAAAAYNDAGDYYLDPVSGRAVRIDNVWSTETFGIKISCSLGVGASSGGLLQGALVRQDLKQAVIEIVAAKSGLWKTNVMTEGGTISTMRTTPSKETYKTLDKYKLRDI